MFKEMCWLSRMGTTGEKVLHLLTAPNRGDPIQLFLNMLYQTIEFLEALRAGQHTRS